MTLDGVEAAASSVQGRGKHLKYRPYAFTEQGVAMLSSVLRSDRAVTVHIEIYAGFRATPRHACVERRSCRESCVDLEAKLPSISRWCLMPSAVDVAGPTVEAPHRVRRRGTTKPRGGQSGRGDSRLARIHTHHPSAARTRTVREHFGAIVILFLSSRSRRRSPQLDVAICDIKFGGGTRNRPCR